jgi:hypothetical protein
MDYLKCIVKNAFELGMNNSFVVTLSSWDEELNEQKFLYTESKEVKFAIKGIEIADIGKVGYAAVVVNYKDNHELQLLQSIKENDTIYFTS